MSGYDAEGLTAHEAHFLQKPFELADLARAMRRVLDDPAAVTRKAVA
jgi:hypothetical protein